MVLAATTLFLLTTSCVFGPCGGRWPWQVINPPSPAKPDTTYNVPAAHRFVGLRWDDGEPPDPKGTDALDSVNSFIATHGWHMHAGKLLFSELGENEKPIKGLPWKAVSDREFKPITHEGILYVPLRGFGTECDGIAYNPATNKFPDTINGFKPIGEHWYVWKQTMTPPSDRQYEEPK